MARTESKIKGKIARIIDRETVVINLGSIQGIDSGSIFYILGDPEEIIDPDTNESLGTVNVTKARVKASQVFEKFTIAKTSWTNRYYANNVLTNFFTAASTLPRVETEEVDEGPLRVNEGDVQPWKARTESPVRIGDIVEVTVYEETEGDAETAARSQDAESVAVEAE